MTEPLLQVRDLRVSVARDGARAVEAVASASLTAFRGEVLGVVGESGAGKTLTLRAITGLLPSGATVTGGEIRFRGRDLRLARAEELRRIRGGEIGMVFQEPMSALNPTMRVGEQIAEGVREHAALGRRAVAARVRDLLGQVGIEDPARVGALYPHQLSGGMRQRVTIAIALSGGPALVLCDEPTTALDAIATARLLALIGDLARTLQVGFVIVTHDLGVVATVCHRVVVMHSGRIVEHGPTQAVLRRPRHPYTLLLRRSLETSTSPTRQSVQDPARGCPFAGRCPLVVDACRAAVPPLVELKGNRGSACLRHELLAAEPTGRT